MMRLRCRLAVWLLTMTMGMGMGMGMGMASMNMAWAQVPAQGAAAQLEHPQGAPNTIRFAIYMDAIRVATLVITARASPETYAARGHISTAGLAGKVITLDYQATANGTRRAGQLHPLRYQDRLLSPRRTTQTTMDYRDGIPRLLRYLPPFKPRNFDVSPASQGGTIDPMSAIYAALRDVPRPQVCTLRRYVFDGRRRGHVGFGVPQPDGSGKLTCTGSYQRLAGYPPKAMAERRQYRLRLTYERTPSGRFRVIRARAATIYGNVEFRRR